MNDITDTHAPTPEFRAALEEEVVRALRRESQIASVTGNWRVRHWRIAAALVIGLVLGVGTGFASAQVQDVQAKNALLADLQARRALTELRVDLARKNLDQVKNGVQVGTLTRKEQLAAESDVRAAEADVVRLGIDMAEVQASGQTPNNELSAPLVGGRDFVSERLELDAKLTHDRIASAQVAYDEVERSFRVGTETSIAVASAKQQMALARLGAVAVAVKLSLRKQYRIERIPPVEMVRRMRELQVNSDIEVAAEQIKLAEQRLSVARERMKVGAATEIEVTRAQLETLQLQLTISQLKLELEYLKTKKP